MCIRDRNYVKAFANEDFINALAFTVKFTIVSVLTVNVLAFLLALALTKGIKGTNLFRTVFFMPNLIGGIVLGYIWQLILNGVCLLYTSCARHGKSGCTDVFFGDACGCRHPSV